MIKRFLTFFLAILLAASLAGCTDSEIADGAVVCSAFPEYDFARQICGDSADVVMLLPCGSEAHDFEPTAKDIKAVAAASLFIYNGGESEVWVERVLLSAGNVRSISLIDCCTSPLYVDGEDGREQDEHIWTSPKNATLMAEKIYNVLCEVFPGKKDVFESNYNALSAKLTALDNACTEMGYRMKGKTVIIGDRNPFGYLARDYGWRLSTAADMTASRRQKSLSRSLKRQRKMMPILCSMLIFPAGKLPVPSHRNWKMQKRNSFFRVTTSLPKIL